MTHELRRRGARGLGIETLSPDPISELSDDYPVHQFWLGNDGVIGENLPGLTWLPDNAQMSLLPLPFGGLDGSSIHAITRYAK